MLPRAKILIVDDDPQMRKTVSDVLKAKGYAPIAVARGRTALARVKKQIPAVALIDLKLEDMSGLELMGEIKEQSPDTECIMLTGYASQESAIEAVNLGAYAYVQKPYDMEQVLLTIQRAVEKGEAERGLRESEERYRALFQESRDAIKITTRDGQFLDGNQSFLDLFGYTREEIMELNARELYADPADRVRYQQETEEEGAVRNYEVRLRKKDGTPMDCLITTTARRADDGRVLAYQSIIRDVTSRKQAEEEIRRRNEELAALNAVANTVAGSLHLDEIVNQALDKVLEMMRVEAGGIYLTDEATSRLTLVAHRGVSEEFVSQVGAVDVGDDVLERVAEQARLRKLILMSEQILKNTTLLEATATAIAREKLRSYIQVLLHIKGSPAGLLVVASREPRRFTAQEQELLSTMANQIGMAIENARLYEAAQRELTERKQAEQARLLSELRFRSLVEQTTDAVFCYEYDPPIPTDLPVEEQVGLFYRGILVECNDVAARSYGAEKPDQVIGGRLVELFGTIPGSLDDFFRAFIENGYGVVDLEGTEKLDDGTERHYLNSGHGVVEDGALVRVWGAFRDVTERKRGEEELRESEEKYRALVEQSLQGLAILRDSRIVFGNTALVEIMGYTLEELSSLSPEEVTALVHPDDRELVWGRLRDRLQGEPVPSRYECRAIRKDGTTRWVEVFPHVVDYQGKTAVQATFVDVTDRKRAEEELRRLNEELTALNAIANTVAGSLHLDEIMNQALDKVLDVMGLEAGGITLLGVDTGQTTPIAYRGVSGKFIQDLQTLGVGGRMADVLTASGEPILIDSLLEDPRAADLRETVQKARLHSVVVVPLRAREAMLGMLAVASRAPHKFTPQDVELLTSIGVQIGMAIDNASLYQEEMQRVFEMEGLRKTTLDITRQLDVPQLLRSIVERAAALAGTKGGGLYLYHPEEEELELVVSHYLSLDEDYTGTRLKVGEGLSGQVIQSGEPLVVEDYTSWEGRSEKYESAPFRAVMAVPLKWGEKIVGVVNVTDVERPRSFTDRDLSLLELFANQAAIAIENARLYEAQERRSQELMALHETSLHIASRLELDSLLEAIIALAMKLLAGETGDVYLYRPAEGDLISAASIGVPPELQRTVVKAGEGLAGKILQTGEPLIVDDYDTWEGRAEKYAGYAFGRVVGVPITYGEDFLGALVVESGLESPRFSEEDVSLLSLFANQAASAIENARLYEGSQRSLRQSELLRTAGETVASTLDLREVLNRIAEQMCLAIDATSVYLSSLDLETNTSTVLTEYYGPEACPEERASDVGQTYQETSEELLDALKANRPIIDHIDDPGLPEDDRAMMLRYGGQSVMYIPLWIREQVIGFGDVWESRRRREFTPDEIAICQDIAQSAAIAIENAELYEQVQTRSAYLETLHRISATLRGTLPLSQVLETVVQGTAEALGYIGSMILVPDAAGKRLVIGAVSGSRFVEAVCGLTGLKMESFGLSLLGAEGNPMARAFLTGELQAWSGHPELIVVSVEPSISPKLAKAIEHAVGAKLAACVPLPVADKSVGVLVVISPREHLPDEERAMLLGLADQAGLAIENARLYEETTRRADELATLYDVSLDVAGQLELSTLLKTILQRAMDLLKGDTGGLYLYDPVRGDLELLVHHALVKDLTGIRVSLGEGLCGKVAQSGEPLVVMDYGKWEERSPHFDDGRTVNALAVPIKRGDTLLGALYLADEDLERTFDEGDIRLGTLFANQAAVAIENARLYEETDRRLRESTTLQEISRLVNSSLQPEQIFQTLVETVASAFGYHFVAIYTLEGEELTLGAQAGYDPAAVYHVIPLNEGVNGRVARRGQAELIRDVSQDPDFLEAAPEIVSEICVPIKKNDLVLGTLSVESTASEPLTEADLDLVSAISHQVSVAIQNAKLYEETRKRLGELSIVYQASIAATSTLDFAEIMERIAEVLQRTLGSTLLTLLLYDEDTQRLRIRAGAGYPPEVVEHIQPRLGEGITGSVALSGEPLNVPDVRGDARYVTSDETVRSELCVPLQVGDRIIGVLDVQSTRLAAFSDDDLRLASTLAGQLSLIIENARLYEETKKRLEELSTLHETSVAATSTMDLAEIFERAVGALQRSLGFSNLTLMLHDEDEQRLKIVAAIGYPPEVAAKVQPKVGEGITGWVASTGEPLCLPDVTKDPRYIAGDERIRSELCVPLEVGDKIIGVLNVESPDLAAFSDDDARLLSTLAGQLAVIIENARLFESLGESEERFRGIFENVMLGLYRTTPDGRILMANPALVRMLGYPSFEELAQRDLEEKRYQPEYPRSDFKRRIESEGQVVGLQSAWKRYDGTTLFIRESARAIRDEAGNTLYYEGTVEDITEQKRAEEDLQQSYHRLQRALEETVNALASMAEKRDPYTAGHQQGVAQLAVAIAKRMSLSQEQIEGIRVAAIVHDIGKIYVPAEILSKPGPLTDREFDMIRFHPQAGHDVLKTIEFPWPVGHIVLQHHEKMDGSGYPQGLSGEEILLEARILAVADVVVAMAAHRPWREARGIHEALQEIRQNRGVSYDPDVVDACLRVFVDDWSELM